MEITKITINGLEYDIVDKTSKELLERMNEPYLLYPTISNSYIDELEISVNVTDGFNIPDYKYFYFTSTNLDRKLYTVAGNMIHLNMVCLTEYLSNVIDNISDEVITIFYGN